jgi:hypothetical protein
MRILENPKKEEKSDFKQVKSNQRGKKKITNDEQTKKQEVKHQTSTKNDQTK